MPRGGIHPVLRQMTIVFRNGASIRVPTVANKPMPYVLQADVTTNPLWTGEKAGLSLEDKRIAKLLSQFKGFVPTGEEAAEQEQQAPAAAAQQQGGKAGKKK